MEMMNRAIEDAADFRAIMSKIEADADLPANMERRYTLVSDRQLGENRAAYRARLKRERQYRKAKA